jgi:hypothetical protein
VWQKPGENWEQAGEEDLSRIIAVKETAAPKRIPVVIPSVPGRKYLARTLPTIRAEAESVLVYQDSPDGWSPSDWSHRQSLRWKSQRAANNYLRCLETPASGPLLVCEDDVELLSGWGQHVSSALASIKDDDYLLVLCHHQPEAVPDPKAAGQTWQRFRYQQQGHGVNTWANTWAVVYSETLRKKLAPFVRRFCVDGDGCYDLAIGYYCLKMGVPIYLANPLLAIHTGTESELYERDPGHVDYSSWNWAGNEIPALSIVTPTIRPSGLVMVWECLKTQTRQDWEWLIGAPAEMHAEIRHLLPADSRIRLVAEPPKNPGDLYALNKTWNVLVSETRCESVVFLVDWIWFPEDTIARLVAHPGGVTGIGHHYREIINGKPEVRWSNDIRAGGSTNILDMELACAKLPRSFVLGVGGFDEQYDRVAGLSEKDLCARIHKIGCELVLDTTIEYRNWTHPKEWPDWDARYSAGIAMFHQHVEEIRTGKRTVIQNSSAKEDICPSREKNIAECAAAV